MYRPASEKYICIVKPQVVKVTSTCAPPPFHVQEYFASRGKVLVHVRMRALSIVSWNSHAVA